MIFLSVGKHVIPFIAAAKDLGQVYLSTSTNYIPKCLY